MVLLFSIGMQYFDACHVPWYRHAITKSALAGVSWIWLHVPLTHHLFRMGLSLKMLAADNMLSSEIDEETQRSFSVTLGIVFFIITLIRITNSLPDSSVSLVDTVFASETRHMLILLFRVVIASLHIVLGYVVHFETPLQLLVVQCSLTLLKAGVDIWNDIMSQSLAREEEAAKRRNSQSNLDIKSLRHFPRQWSNLQMVNKETLLELNMAMMDELPTVDEETGAVSSDHQQQQHQQFEKFISRRPPPIAALVRSKSEMLASAQRLTRTNSGVADDNDATVLSPPPKKISQQQQMLSTVPSNGEESEEECNATKLGAVIHAVQHKPLECDSSILCSDPNMVEEDNNVHGIADINLSKRNNAGLSAREVDNFDNSCFKAVEEHQHPHKLASNQANANVANTSSSLNTWIGFIMNSARSNGSAHTETPYGSPRGEYPGLNHIDKTL